MALFDNVKNVFQKEDIPEVGGKSAEVYMVSRFLSMTPHSVLDAVDAGKYLGKIPNWAYDRLLFFLVEKKNSAPYIKYIKKKGDNVDKVLLGKVCTAFCCNERHGREYIEVLKAEGHNPKHLFGLKGK